MNNQLYYVATCFDICFKPGSALLQFNDCTGTWFGFTEDSKESFKRLQPTAIWRVKK